MADDDNDAELRARIEVLKEELEAGRVKIFADLSSVDNCVRSLANMVSHFRYRREAKEAVSPVESLLSVSIACARRLVAKQYIWAFGEHSKCGLGYVDRGVERRAGGVRFKLIGHHTIIRVACRVSGLGNSL